MSSLRTLCGVDLVDFEHLRDVMRRHPGFAERVFTDAERRRCADRRDPIPHYAARFAAKEALLKTLGLGISATGIDRTWREIEVARDGGAPRLDLSGRVAARAAALGAHGFALSMTHGNEHAVAVVTALAPEEAA